MGEADEHDLEIGTTGLAVLQIVAPFFGPPGVMTAIVAGVLGSTATQWTSRKSLKRVQEFLDQLSHDTEQRMAEFEERLSSAEDAEDLAARATRAATLAASESHSRALANLLAAGVLGDASDTQKSELLISVLDGLTASEVDGLARLENAQRRRASEKVGSAVAVLSDGRIAEVPLAEAVVSRLVGRGMLRIDPGRFTDFGLTSLGVEVLAILSENEGADSPGTG